MRLLRLETDGYRVYDFVGKDVPPYAILSHTWGEDWEEVSFRDLTECRDIGKDKKGYIKLFFCALRAAIDGLQYFWIDTCCIDKSSSVDLSEAINRMFSYYQKASRCYVYLSDINTESLWRSRSSCSRWFTRGWTLQELLAPRYVQFFSQEGNLIGDKASLSQDINCITGIPVRALQGGPLEDYTVDERMSWAARRETKREEDAAYSLLGIFGIHMLPLYGEGRDDALDRLRRKIKKAAERRIPVFSLGVERGESPENKTPTERKSICSTYEQKSMGPFKHNLLQQHAERFHIKDQGIASGPNNELVQPLANQASLNKHVKHTIKRKCLCQACGQAFTGPYSQNLLQQHMEKFHPGDGRDIKHIKHIIKQKCLCQACGQAFTGPYSQNLLQQHMEKFHPGDRETSLKSNALIRLIISKFE